MKLATPLFRHLLFIGHSSIDQVTGIIGRSHQHAVALPCVDHVNFKKALVGKYRLGDPPFFTPRLDPHPLATRFPYLDMISPEEIGDSLVVVLERNLELPIGIVDELTTHDCKLPNEQCLNREHRKARFYFHEG
jgi:hypothetical protein